MGQQASIAVIGAGIVGAAVAYALAREDRAVLLLDRDQPGVAGASFGNVGHIAAEAVQPLPSPGLLLGFRRQLVERGGVLDLPSRQVLRMRGWIARFAVAAFRRAAHTAHLAPLVSPASRDWSRWLAQIGEHTLLKTHGHYEVSLRTGGEADMATQARAMQALGIDTREVPQDQLRALREAARATHAAGLWYPQSAHVVDPLRAVQTFVQAAIRQGAKFERFDVRALKARGERIEIIGEGASLSAGAVVVCAGLGSTALLKNLGINAPLVAARGYHLEVAGAPGFLDAPVVYTHAHLVVTPMSGRVRASSFMEFRPCGAPADPKKVEHLRRLISELGYGEARGEAWVGGRPVLPDYLPGIGRAIHQPNLFYAVGHQHIGLTLAPVTGDLMADLVAGRPPRHALGAFDLRRFGAA